jgi:putative tryptophan/tyrosine transport system substrate-binding protein
MRRIGVLMPGTESDQEEQLRVTAFQQRLAKLGWTDARNVQIDYRWGGVDIDRMRTFATELVGLRPDVLFAGNTTTSMVFTLILTRSPAASVASLPPNP